MTIHQFSIGETFPCHLCGGFREPLSILHRADVEPEILFRQRPGLSGLGAGGSAEIVKLEGWNDEKKGDVMSVLTEAMAHEYVAQSYLLVSGLIPEEVAAAAEAAMWQLLNDSPDDAASWEQVRRAHQSYDSPELRACHTPSFLAAAAQLSGDPLETIGVPKRAYAINVFPSSGEWKWPRPHIDHAIKEHLHKTFPRAFRIATITFLSDVPPHGGGTVVWPGSHAVLERLAKSDPERFEMMWTLNHELPHVTLADPVELTPKRGDVLFYSYLCAHAGSQNTSDRPRLALNTKW